MVGFELFKMRIGASRMLAALALSVLTECSLSNLDDLSRNANADASAQNQCKQFVSCAACVGCDALCACLAPKSLSECLFNCLVDGAASGGAGGASAGGAGGTISGGGAGGTPAGGGGLDQGGSGGTPSGGGGAPSGGAGGTGGSAEAGTFCQECIAAHCSDQSSACAANSECLALGTCIVGCSVQTCVQACIAAHPGGAVAYDAFVNCVSQACGTQCGPGQ